MRKELFGSKFLPRLYFLHIYLQGLIVKGTCVAHLGAPALCKAGLSKCEGIWEAFLRSFTQWCI